jgi:hypothetical protein
MPRGAWRGRGSFYDNRNHRENDVMDAKNIYILGNRFAKKVKWEKQTTDSEWLHVGKPCDIRCELLEQVVSATFYNDKVYVIKDKKDSKVIDRKEILEIVRLLKERESIMFSNLDFTTYLEYNSIGTIRKGSRAPS